MPSPFTGTITQTTPAITQSATAAQNILEETASATGYPFITLEDELSEYATAYGPIVAIVEEDTESTANASEVITFDVISSLEDTATASNSFVAEDFVNIGSTARATDTFTAWYAITLTDQVNAGNSFELSRDIELTDTAVATGSTDPSGIYSYLISDTANISGAIYTGQEVSLATSATAAEDLVVWSVVLEAISVTANVTDTWVPWNIVTEELSSTALGSSTYSFEGSIYNETLAAAAAASDWIWAKNFDSIAWVLNTQSGGLTNYDNYGFTSLAFHSGTLYATSPEGIFQLDADKDAGRNISATCGYGFLDLGTQNKKHVSDIFVGCTGNDLECEVETYDKLAYTYGMEYRDVDTPYNNRIKPGRGLSSRWWRFTFRNIDGADFQIHDVAVQVARSNRRL